LVALEDLHEQVDLRAGAAVTQRYAGEPDPLIVEGAQADAISLFERIEEQRRGAARRLNLDLPGANQFLVEELHAEDLDAGVERHTALDQSQLVVERRLKPAVGQFGELAL